MASERHLLKITRMTEEGYDPWNEYQVIHSPDCPTETVPCFEQWCEEDPPHEDHRYTHFTCGVEYEVANVGLDGLDCHPFKSWEELPEGEYEITFWFEHYRGGWWGDDEWDSGLSFVLHPCSFDSDGDEHCAACDPKKNNALAIFEHRIRVSARSEV